MGVMSDPWDAFGHFHRWVSGVFKEEDMPIGSIALYAGVAAPDKWLLCRGQEISRSTYSALFSIVGTAFGAGDGSNTFNLPDLRGRCPVGAGWGDGLTDRELGEQVGDESIELSISNLPAHTHDIPLTGEGTGGVRGGGGFGAGLTSTLPRGGGTAHPNMQPSLVLNGIIRHSQ